MKSNYTLKPYKPLKAKIVESTAVKVASAIGGFFRRKWVKLTGGIVSAVRENTQENIGNEIDKLKTKIAEDKSLVDAIRKDENASIADDLVMISARKQIEKLEAKLSKLLKKQVKLETKKAISPDFEDVMKQVLNPNFLPPITAEDLSKDFGGAVVEPIVANAPEVQPMPVEEPVVEPVQNTTPEPVASDKEDADLTPEKIDEVVENFKNRAAENAKLREENRNLLSENARLKAENSKLLSENNRLKVENSTLKSNVKNQTTLEQKISEYEALIERRNREIEEMTNELEQYRFSTKENEERIKQLIADIEMLQKENKYFKRKLNTIVNAMDFNDPMAAPTQTVVEEEPRQK